MAYIFDIKRFAINDGPGIRTTVFIKGCPLRCVWCHNPEGLDSDPVKLYTAKKCIGCQSCVDACPEHNLRLTPDGIVDLGGCTACGRCTDECPTLALQMAGTEYQMDDLMAIIEKERHVMEQSGGGITICGGEPLMHPDYLESILTELGKRGLHRTVDTTLFASADTVRRIAHCCELMLVDIKHTDSTAHKTYTGVANERILDNIRLLSDMPDAADYWIRIPLIGGVNADDENMHHTAEFLTSLKRKPSKVCLLPYHDTGRGKHARLGSAYNPANINMYAPDDSLQQHVLNIFRQHNITAQIGG